MEALVLSNLHLRDHSFHHKLEEVVQLQFNPLHSGCLFVQHQNQHYHRHLSFEQDSFFLFFVALVLSNLHLLVHSFHRKLEVLVPFRFVNLHLQYHSMGQKQHRYHPLYDDDGVCGGVCDDFEAEQDSSFFLLSSMSLVLGHHLVCNLVKFYSWP